LPFISRDHTARAKQEEEGAQGSAPGATSTDEAKLDPYAVLSVAKDATMEDIKKAYKVRNIIQVTPKILQDEGIPPFKITTTILQGVGVERAS
jgi:hypothetical protein